MPDFTSPEKAVHALKAMVDYSTWLQKPVEQSVATVGDSAKVAEIIKSYRASGIDQVNEYDAKRVFRAYGIPTAAGDLAKSESEARSAAEKIGFPVVMKIVSPDIIHKSDIGGVKLNLKSADEVAQAYTTMMERVLAAQPEARITGVYIEKMGSRDGLEVIAGMTRDPQFGPLIMFGLGGIFVEVLKDVTFRLAPLSKTEAIEMMNGIKAAALLKGVRGKPGVHLDTLADTIVKLSRLVSDFPAIMELDINPFIATADAATSFAADARITLAPQS
jgi:acetyltransferase